MSSLFNDVLRLPVGENAKLKALVRSVSEDKRLQTYWKCSNVMAIERMGYTDHGPVHVKIVANSALKMLRILVEKGIVPSVVKDYGMTNEDAELIVVLASIFHDLGMIVLRDRHEEYSLLIALEFLRKHLGAIYDEEQASIVTSEVLHALATTHQSERKPLTIEAGIVRIADALDMERGRARIPFSAGRIDIHSVSALSIERVRIEAGEEKPLIIRVQMSGSAGIFQVDQLLRERIRNSGLENYIHVVATITEEHKTQVIEKFEI